LIVLGINAYHADSSACVLVNGKLVAAAEEERFLRIKHWAGFPGESINFCLAEQGIVLRDVDIVAINTDPKAARFKKLKYLLRNNPSFGLVFEKIRTRKKRNNIRQTLEARLGMEPFKGEVTYVEHHAAHLASAFLVSPFPTAAMLSVDGFGDFCSTAWGLGEDCKMSVDGRVFFPHSLGVFYQAITQYLGFPKYGDEFKVMGLAPYGRDSYGKEISSLLSYDALTKFRLDLKYFRHHRHRIGYEWDNGIPEVSDLFSKELENLIGPRRRPEDSIKQKHKDLARSTQIVYENAFFELLSDIHGDYETENLVLSGGCAMNSVANGKVYQRTPFKHLYVQPAAGDAGGAVGAALVAYSHRCTNVRPEQMASAFTGPRFSDKEIKNELDALPATTGKCGCHIEYQKDFDSVLSETAGALEKGKVVGWFQGRMEWGPRALGNRSILCDPRRPDVKEILNTKIKRRESFRPFAPSILREYVSEWFEQDDDVPFMEKVFKVIREKRELIPGVTHVDGTGRLQTVTKDSNPQFYDLINIFGLATGVPILLNTSFNENEPLVCRPREALECFMRTNMDMLVLGKYVVTRLH